MTAVLGIKDFFYVPDKSYDYLAEKSLPYYHEAHHVLVSSLGFKKNQKAEIIDLGIGTGVTAAYILKNYPKVKVTGTDLFDEMLTGAEVRLKPFANRLTLKRADNVAYLKTLSQPVDAIVSAFCIHHLDPKGKKQLFRLAFKNLLPGGRFIMLDLTTFNDPLLKKTSRQSTINHMMANVKNKAYQAKWKHHWNNINKPSPADMMIQWLREAGFHAEIAFRNGEVAVLVATKRGVPRG